MRIIIFSLVAAICTLMMFIVPASALSVNSNYGLIAQSQPSSELSLCNLSKDIELYRNKAVRVRAAVLGMGGHYPFFVTASGCNPDEVVVLHVKFHNGERTGAILHNRLDEVLRLNLTNSKQKAEAIIVGRVEKKSCNECPNPELLISVVDVELKVPPLKSRE